MVVVDVKETEKSISPVRAERRTSWNEEGGCLCKKIYYFSVVHSFANSRFQRAEVAEHVSNSKRRIEKIRR